jgi:hypothetical protein
VASSRILIVSVIPGRSEAHERRRSGFPPTTSDDRGERRSCKRLPADHEGPWPQEWTRVDIDQPCEGSSRIEAPAANLVDEVAESRDCVEVD